MSANDTIKECIDNFENFLKKFSTNGKKYTYTRIGKYPYSGSYDIPPGINNTLFINKYCELCKLLYKNKSYDYVLNFSECQQDMIVGPLMLDLDFEFKNINYDESKRDLLIQHRYSENDIKIVVEFINSILINYFEIQEESIVAYIQEKPYACIKYDKNGNFSRIKDGFHICYILPFTKEQRLFIRNNLCEYFTKEDKFKHLQFDNSYDSIFDVSTLSRNNWLLYGSYKYIDNGLSYPFPYIYTCEYYYTYYGEKKEIDMTFDELVTLFSIRQMTDDPLIIKSEFIDHFNNNQQNNKLVSINSTSNDNTCTGLFNINDYEDLKNIYIKEPIRELLFIKGLLNLLSQERCDDYEYWIHICWALSSYNKHDKNLYQLFIDFSKRSVKFDENECYKAWNKSRESGKCVTLATIKKYAKEDNHKNYKLLLDYYYSGLRFKIIKYAYDIDIVNYIYVNYGDHHKYCGVSKTWYDFNGNMWEAKNDAYELSNIISNKLKPEFERYISEERNIHNQESNGKKSKMSGLDYDKIEAKLFNKLGNNSGINSIKSLCTITKYTDNEIENKLDMNPYLIGFDNGIYDLKNMIFRKGKPDDYVSISVGYDYQEYDINDPIIQKIKNYFKSLFPEDEVCDYILRYLSSRLEGKNTNNQFNIWTGKASNGKSVFTSLLQKLYGNYYYTLEHTAITGKRVSSEAATPALAGLKGKRIVIIQEPDSNDEIKIAFIKQLSGGQDRISVRRLYKDVITFIPQCEFILICNSIPNLNNVDQGIARRLSVVNFNTTFVHNRTPNPAKHEAKADNNIIHYIESNEWTAPLMWLLINIYYKEYKQFGLLKPSSVMYATQSYIYNSDECKEFLDDMYVIDLHNELTNHDSDQVTIDEFYNMYTIWTKNKCYTRKYRTKAKLIEHLVQSTDVKVENSVIIGLYNKMTNTD